MIIRCEQLYQELLTDLFQCFNKGLPLLIEIECGFRTAEKYRRLVKDEIAQYTFAGKVEEIHFYKNINPAFIGESAYYRLLNYGHNFCPEDAHPEEKNIFWTRQVNRLQQYRVKFSEFYRYYSSGGMELDELYYTVPLPGRYDELCGELRARERYAAYAAEQLKLLKSG